MTPRGAFLDVRSDPAVSVIVPTYERRELVLEAVASVLAQTLADFELIVVDDGSTDGTGEALQGLDPRLVYLWQENRGVAAARNTGIRRARGDIVAFLDSDDRWLPDHLTVVTETLERNPEAVLVTTCPQGVIKGSEEPANARVADLLPKLLISNNLGFVPCIAVRREALVAVDGFDEALPVAEGPDLWRRLALLGPCALLRRRTIVRRWARGSLKERGRRGGAYLAAYERMSGKALAEIEARPDRHDLLARARARAGRAIALGTLALSRHDREAARACFREACADDPELSRDPTLVGRLSNTVYGSRQLAHLFELAAETWPEPRSDTALFMRAYAALHALRAWAPRQAWRLLAYRGFLACPGFAVRTWPQTRKMIRRRLQGTGPREPGRAQDSVMLWRWASTFRRLMAGTQTSPLRPLWALAYGLLLRRVVAAVCRGEERPTIYVKGSLASERPAYGISDLDLILVCPAGSRDARERIANRWTLLRKRSPNIGRMVELWALDEGDLPSLRGRSYATFGLDTGASVFAGSTPAGDHADFLTRPGLCGPMVGLRRLRGPDRLPPLDYPGEQARRIYTWLELQFWWRHAFRACVSPDLHFVPFLCGKLVAEPARIWLWLARGELAFSRDDALRRLLALRPEEEPAVRLALALDRSPTLRPAQLVERTLPTLVRLSRLIAGRILEEVGPAGVTAVRLDWGGHRELMLSPGETDALRPLGVDPRSLLPLVDWRGQALVFRAVPDETAAAVPGNPADPASVRAAAEAGRAGPYPILVDGSLLALPADSWPRPWLRAVQCPATDPVTFALVDGRTSAAFPNVPGWSIADCSRRAVAELGAWLSLEPGRTPPPVRTWLGQQPDPGAPSAATLGLLFCAARAGLLAESLEARAPELHLTVAATARALTARDARAGVALDAADAYRRCRESGADPSATLVTALREVVLALPAFAGVTR